MSTQTETYLKLAFPRVYGLQGLQSQPAQSETLLSHIIKYFQKQFKGENVVENVGNRLNKIVTKTKDTTREQTVLQFGYGCSLVLERLSPESDLNFYVVFNSLWEVEMANDSQNSMMFQSSLPEYKILYGGHINIIGSLSQLKDRFLQQFSKIQGSNSSYNASWFVEACKKAAQMLSSGINSGVNTNSAVFDMNSKGTKLDTIWSTTWASIYFFDQNSQLIKALIFDFKLYLLLKHAKAATKQESLQQNNTSLKQKIETYMECLQQARSNAEDLNRSSNFFYSNQKTCKKFTQIAAVIYSIDVAQQKTKYQMKEVCQKQKEVIYNFDTKKFVPKFIPQDVKDQCMSDLSSVLEIKDNVFSSLLNKYQYNSHSWVMAVQDTIFTLAFNELSSPNPFKDQSIGLIKTKNSENYLTQLFQNYYQEMMRNWNQFAMGLKCQAYSHIQLMKAIFCVIAFQIFKREMKGTIYDVGTATVPLNHIDQFYRSFNSLSYKARRAMQALYKYLKPLQHRQKLFNQIDGYTNYKIYANKVSSKSHLMIRQKERKQAILQEKKKQLRKKIRLFHEERNKIKEQIKAQQEIKCSCKVVQYEQREYSWYSYTYRTVTKYRTIQCSRCTNLKNLRNKLNTHQQKCQYDISTQLPRDDKLIHEFFYQIDDNLAGLMLVVLMAQHQSDITSKNKYYKNYLQMFQRKILRIFIMRPSEPKEFRLLQKTQQDVQKLINYAGDSVDIQWKSRNNPTLSYSKMQKDQDLNICGSVYRNFVQFMRNPNSISDVTRQHDIYSNLQLKPSYVDIEQYIALGSCRVGTFTQIPVVLQSILKRTIEIDTLQANDYQFKQMILYRCLSSLCVQKPYHIELDACENIRKGVFYYFHFFLNNYYKELSTQDFNGLPILGPVISLLIRIVTDQSLKRQKLQYIHKNRIIYNNILVQRQWIIQKILDKINVEYQRLEQDYQNTPLPSIRQNQYYVCFAGITCFTQLILNCKMDLNVEFVKLIVVMTFREVYIKLNQKSPYSKIVTKLQKFKNQAIQNNIRVAVQYLQANIAKLTDIVKVVDEGIPNDTNWVKDKGGDYLFTGKTKWGDIYKIDIKHGRVTKNGKSTSKIPQDFKKTKQYIEIFNNQDFQVYPSPDKKSLLTKRNFSQLFVGNIDPGDSVLFQFGYAKKLPTINLRIRYNKKNVEQTWRLINLQQLKAILPLPKLYSTKYYAWYCAQRSCIIFKKRKLAQIAYITLVAFIDQLQNISRIHIISKQHQRSHLDFLCDKKKFGVFDKLIPRWDKVSPPYQIFKKIEKVQYIIEMESEEGIRKFWLHRFDIFFMLDAECRVVPQGFRDYKLCNNPYVDHYIPWSEKDQIPCLVFQKYNFTETNQSFHEKRILIPEWACRQEPFITISEDSDIDERRYIYSYDIHDHFHDIRSGTRLAQLHLASILAFVNKNLRNNAINMTPAEYALKILLSCFSNEPLTNQQLNQVHNIVAIASRKRKQSLVLMCYALVRCTLQISSLRNQVLEKYQLPKSISFQSYALKAMSRYNWKMMDGLLPYRQVLPDYICKIIGLQNYSICLYTQTGRFLSWQKQNKINIVIPPNTISQNILKYKQTLKQWLVLNQQIVNSVDVILQKEERDKKKQFPLNIQIEQDQNLLLYEVIQQLKDSYSAYHESKIRLNSININKKEAIVKFRQMLKILIKSKNQIDELLNGIIMQNRDHIDIVTGHFSVLSTFDFVNLLIEQDNQDDFNKLIDKIFPGLGQDEQSQILELIKTWVLFSIKINSCERILNILNHKGPKEDQQADKIALFRECESPRDEVQSRKYWICFEAEMKLQIWKYQFQTFSTLLYKSQTGSCSQLNMGEGKTQVIIPMITLEVLYGRNFQNMKIFKNCKNNSKLIPRANLMESLINECKTNYFRYLSATSFNIPIVVLPFNRKVDIKNPQKIPSIIRSLDHFKQKMLILVDQSSTHSLILKLRQETINSKSQRILNKQVSIFKNLNLFDIFDEVDAQLSPKKSFVYSIGSSSSLDHLDFRASIASGLIQALCIVAEDYIEQGLLVFDETREDVQKSLEQGKFPHGLRLISNCLSSINPKLQFRRKILRIYLKQIDSQETRFFQMLNQKQKAEIREYIVDDEIDEINVSAKVSDQARKILYALRGLLAHGIFEFCLSQRCKVNYGIPDIQRKKLKRLAVPYQAADIPSKKNDYAHPDVAMILTLLSYYNCGLQKQQVIECLQKMFKMTGQNHETQKKIYKDWHSTLSDVEKQKLKISSTLQIKLHSVSQKERLFEAFRMNRKFIDYWVRNCVFVKDTIQFTSSITSSSWDHSKVETCIGFSGTKDNSRLMPTYVQLIESPNRDIKGTDGKMLDMLIQNVLEVSDFQGGKEAIWQRFLNTVINLPAQYKVSSIIDAGALLASKSLKDDIIPWIVRNQQFNKNGKFKGISFCLDNVWKVYKISSHECIERGVSIPDNETFVIFDEYRTRGADMKMDADITAVLTLSPSITKDALMQAVGRLRKIGRNQKLVILLTQQLVLQLKKDYPEFSLDLQTKEKVKIILSWSCTNSVKENNKFFLPNARLAKIHYNNQIDKKSPKVQYSDTTLKSLYAASMKYLPVSQLCKTTLKNVLGQNLNARENVCLQKLLTVLCKYGTDIIVKSQNLQEVCERQTQLQRQEYQEKQILTYSLQSIPQKNKITPEIISNLFSFSFTERLMISYNFYECTKMLNSSNRYINQINQLMKCFFVLLSEDGICIVTQRQVNMLLLNESIPFFIPKTEQKSPKYIARLCDIQQQIRCFEDFKVKNYLRDNQLIQAYAQCKFFNGSSEYQSKQQQKIIRKLLTNEKNKYTRTQYFLDKRRLTYKFKNSDLQRIYKELLLLDSRGCLNPELDSI